ncbi:MAG: hypothetical protein EOM12_03510 [Verrucomicrobiae bacterium]|nr:hypothetical protein [Verrucomicrobiae bacterium]
MSETQAYKNIEVAALKREKYPFSAISPGENFFIPGLEKIPSVRTLAYSKKKEGKKFSVRKKIAEIDGETTVGICVTRIQ